MTYIKNNKTLVFIIAILLLSNIALLYFFTRSDEPKKDTKENRGGFREYMIKTLRDEVGFTDDQIARYEQLSNKHKETMKPMFEGIGMTKDSLYKLLLQDPSDSLTNHYLDMIGEKQRGIDQKIFNHFLSLRQICTTDQRPKFDTVIQRIIKKMISPRKGGDKDKDKGKK
jgi:hypothetical protein